VQSIQELDEEQAIRLVQSTIRAVYEDDNIVILGRGGQAILKEMPGVLHVRIEAPLDIRGARIQGDEETGQQRPTEKTIVERDKAAAAYLKRFYGIDWADPVHYHLVINTGKFDVEAAAHLIVNALAYLPPAESAEPAAE
jgi:cytidylate kinase